MDRTSIKQYLQESKLGFIGAGKMAQAIANGLLSQGLINPREIFASAPSNKNLKIWEEKGMNVTHKNDVIVRECKIIFLAVKPQYLSEALSHISPIQNTGHRLFVSVIAGISSTSLEESLCKLVPSSRVVRVMPNIPVIVGAGCSVLCGGSTSNTQDIEIVKGILSEVGTYVEVKETMMAGAGVIAGCGPAFMYLMIEAIADGGVNVGVPRDMAQQLAAQTMLGAAQMVLKTGCHPGQLKDDVCSPGGSTIAGIQALENRGIRAAMMAAVEASTLRSLELGKKK